MIVDQRFMHEALTRWNYFPNQKQSVGELPPWFQTRRFTPEIANILAGLPLDPRRRREGFDLVEYRATRYSNVPRILGLIHPKAYALLAKTISNNFNNIQGVLENPSSAVKPEWHDDGRIIIMNYECQDTKVQRQTAKGFGNRFRVHTDISHCFSSIYTHAIEWAVRGVEEAKIARFAGNQAATHWACELDKAQSRCKRCETQGIPIGPATSSIIVELILHKIDERLRNEGFDHIRYVDDYSCSCRTHEHAQKFLQVLDQELRRFRLSLNLHKTEIVELPEPISEDWVSNLCLNFPTTRGTEGNNDSISRSDALTFLDHAVRLNKSTPDGSVLKFAIAMLTANLSDGATELIFEYTLNLSWHYPIVLPYLDRISKSKELFNGPDVGDKINEIIFEHAQHGRSDAMAWGLYYLLKARKKLGSKISEQIINSRDCAALALLCRFPGQRTNILKVVNDEILIGDIHKKDNYWLLLYELFRIGKIENPYPGDDTFHIMKKYDVRFIHGDNASSKAEDYCGYFDVAFQVFGNPEDVPDFEAYAMVV